MRVNVVCGSSIIMCRGCRPRLSGTGRSKTCNHQMNYPRGDYFHTYILHKLSRTQHQQNILRKLQTEHITANIAGAYEKIEQWPKHFENWERIFEREEERGIGGGNRSCGVFRDPAQNIIITSSFSNFPKFESPTQITFLTNVCRATPTRTGAARAQKRSLGPKTFWHKTPISNTRSQGNWKKENINEWKLSWLVKDSFQF